MASEESRFKVWQGTLDLISLRTLQAIGPQHVYAIATRLEQISEQPLKLNQGTLYSALVRLEQEGCVKGSWAKTDSHREAKFYARGRESARTRSGSLAPNGGVGVKGARGTGVTGDW